MHDLKEEVTDTEKKEQEGKVIKKKICIGIVLLFAIVLICVKLFGSQNKQQDAVVTDQNVGIPIITVYQDKIVTGVNSKLELQNIIESIDSEITLYAVEISVKDETLRDNVQIEDVQSGKEKKGVPAKTLEFSKEGTYEIVVTATDIKENEAEISIIFEVGPELVSYVNGLHDWTVEVDSTDIDFMSDVSWDENFVSEVQADASKVDVTKEGVYELIYRIKGSDTVVEESVSVTIISKKESEQKADEGEKVVTSGGKVKKDSSGNTPVGNISTSKTDTSSGNNNATSKPSTGNGNNTSSKPSTDNGNNTGSKPSTDNGNNTGSKPSTDNGSNSTDSKPTHTHTWVEQFKSVQHDAVYETQWVVDKEAWTEYKPIYENIPKNICNQCGLDITGNESQHNKKHALAGEPGGWHSQTDIVLIRTDVISHPEEGHYEQICVKEAWTEQVSTGYKCSCGATRQN